MNFSHRTYVDIVRDLLTTLTGGTVAEEHHVPLSGVELIPLYQQPVRRVSHLVGSIELGGEQVDYQFTERDFELVGTESNPNEYAAIRFRDGAHLPAPGSTLVVNYYPSRCRPTPLTDINVGSVTRTLLETVAREMATQYQQLQRVYDSAFIETATGSALDRVVALVDVTRLRQRHPVGQVRFYRRPGSPGTITIPIHTAVTDGQRGRYLTSQEGSLLPNQSSLDVWVHGELPTTDLADKDQLVVLERAIAGVDGVTNPDPTWRATDDETDTQLAARARRAIHAPGKGTMDAIRFGLESLDFVGGVKLTERPDGVPGTLRADIALTENNAHNRMLVTQRLDDLRPAGIQVTWNAATPVDIGLILDLTLAGGPQPTSVVEEIKDGIVQVLRDYIDALPPNGVVRPARLVALALRDERLVDVAVTCSVGGAVISGPSDLPTGRSATLVEPIQFSSIAFEDSPAVAQLTQVFLDLYLEVKLLSGGVDGPASLDELQATLQHELEPLLGNLQAGTSQDRLSFQMIQQAVRDDALFVLRPQNSVATLEDESGTFTELRSGDPPYQLLAGITLVLRTLELVEEE